MKGKDLDLNRCEHRWRHSWIRTKRNLRGQYYWSCYHSRSLVGRLSFAT